MRTGNSIKTLIGACAIGAMAWASLQATSAAETGKDVSKEISDLRSTVVSAEVLLTPRRYHTRGSVTEADLSKAACHFQVTERKDLDPLLDILANAGIVEEGAPDEDGMRFAVYLHTVTGRVIRLVTGQDFTDAPAIGMYNRITPIAVKSGFEADLRFWAAQRMATKPTGRCPN